jgi:glucosamine kinase
MSESDTGSLFGIDGGGSTCRFALMTGGVRTELSLGAANAFTDRAGAIATLRDGITALASGAGLSQADVASARLHAGLAGIMTAADAADVAAALPVRQARVTDDRPTSLRGALGGADGTLAAIGTGSFFGRQNGGDTRFIGGWGFRLGDEASGAWIGRSLLSSVLHAVDGLRPMTPLIGAVLDDFDDAPSKLVTAAQDYSPRDFAALAARAVDAARQNDPLAIELMRDGAAWTIRAVTALGWTRAEPLCLIGGLGPHYAPFMDADVSAPRGNALDGALALAGDLPRAGVTQ